MRGPEGGLGSGLAGEGLGGDGAEGWVEDGEAEGAASERCLRFCMNTEGAGAGGRAAESVPAQERAAAMPVSS